MSVSDSTLLAESRRREAAEARAAQASDDLSKRDDVIRGLSNRLTEVFNQLEKAEARSEAAEAALQAVMTERDALRKQLEQAQALIEQVRAEALARFEAVDKDHTMDNDTEAWLLEVAQRLERPQ